MIVHAKDVPHLTKLEYFQLAEGVRPAARQSVMDEEVKAVRREIADARTRMQGNIHAAVNDPYHIEKIARHLKQIQALKDVKRMERCIDSNLCHFLEDGTYVLYMPRPD